MLGELDQVEREHKKAIQILVGSYEKSLLSMKQEINKTVGKLKNNGQYFERILNE